VGSFGYYWSSTICCNNQNGGYNLKYILFYSGPPNIANPGGGNAGYGEGHKAAGMSVRCLKD
jgi:hypothetical protein